MDWLLSPDSTFTNREPELLSVSAVDGREVAMSNQPEQDALFQIEGPDEDGCVWACSPEGRYVWCQNLGPTEKVVEVLSQWLGSIDAGEAS